MATRSPLARCCALLLLLLAAAAAAAPPTPPSETAPPPPPPPPPHAFPPQVLLAPSGLTDCCVGACVVHWRVLGMAPEPPQRGARLEARAAGKTAKSIKSGAGTIHASLNGLPLYSADIATCGETELQLPGAGTATLSALACPTRGRGNVTLTLALDVPPGAPGGHYDVRAAAGDQHGKPAFCLDASFDL